MENHFLPFFIQEHIYLVDKPTNSTPETDENAVDKEPEEKGYAKDLAPAIDHSIAVIVNTGGSDSLTPADQQLLEKILQAVSLNFQEVGVYYFGGSQNLALPFRDLKKVIGFGVPPENLIKNDPPGYYQIITEEGGTACLFANELQAIAKDVQKKKMLWAKLQELCPK